MRLRGNSVRKQLELITERIPEISAERNYSSEQLKAELKKLQKLKDKCREWDVVTECLLGAGAERFASEFGAAELVKFRAALHNTIDDGVRDRLTADAAVELYKKTARQREEASASAKKNPLAMKTKNLSRVRAELAAKLRLQIESNPAIFLQFCGASDARSLCDEHPLIEAVCIYRKHLKNQGVLAIFNKDIEREGWANLAYDMVVAETAECGGGVIRRGTVKSAVKKCNQSKITSEGRGTAGG